MIQAPHHQTSRNVGMEEGEDTSHLENYVLAFLSPASGCFSSQLGDYPGPQDIILQRFPSLRWGLVPSATLINTCSKGLIRIYEREPRQSQVLLRHPQPALFMRLQITHFSRCW